MKRLECPHCHESRITHARFTSDMVVIMQCPGCGELVVTFRQKVVGLNRDLLENGERTERKKHLANVIAEFLDPDFLDELNFDEMSLGIGLGAASQPSEAMEDAAEEGAPADAAEADAPISDSELRSFMQNELSKLDDSDYFRRHFS